MGIKNPTSGFRSNHIKVVIRNADDGDDQSMVGKKGYSGLSEWVYTHDYIIKYFNNVLGRNLPDLWKNCLMFVKYIYDDTLISASD